MIASLPPKRQEICRRLFRGYQFSESDGESADLGELYDILDEHIDWFEEHLQLIGFTLIRDDGVIFLEKEEKDLSKEEMQTIVILFLLVDLWMEKGKAYSDLFQVAVPWPELDWFRDGYGREYLAQVGIEDQDTIEEAFRKIAGKGLVEYNLVARKVRLRKPAERLITLARKIHKQIKTEEHAA